VHTRFAPHLALSVSVCLLVACSKPAAPPPHAPAVPVTVATAVRRSVPLQLNRIGAVEAYSTIAVKAQIGGYLTKVFFQEGQEVEKDQMLFQIDPRPYEQALRQAEANLARDLAQMQQAEANLTRDLAQARNARAQATRYAQLAGQGIISKEQNEDSQTNAHALEAAANADRAAIESARAAVNADRAAIERAKIDLEYCAIRSPIRGRTGNLLVKEGNLVKANADTAMVNINQIQPIYVSFSVPQQRLGEIRSFMAQKPLTVEAYLSESSGEAERGLLSFVDNAVDEATGTIKLKATFPNPKRRLWPGQFVNVVLTLATESNVTLVPSEAVQPGQEGQYAFVVKSDQTVESRTVKVGRTVGSEIIIEQGIQPGDTVVTDGQLRIVPGAKVRVVSSPAAASQAAEGS